MKIVDFSENYAQMCVNIYNYYIESTTVTFEVAPLTASEFSARAAKIMQKYPYFVAVEEGKILGYAYLSPFHERAAYAPTADVSVYLDKDERGRGVGRALMAALEDAAPKIGVKTLISVITSENADSRAFHEKLGYERVAHLPEMAEKFGRTLGIDYYRKNVK